MCCHLSPVEKPTTPQDVNTDFDFWTVPWLYLGSRDLHVTQVPSSALFAGHMEHEHLLWTLQPFGRWCPAGGSQAMSSSHSCIFLCSRAFLLLYTGIQLSQKLGPPVVGRRVKICLSPKSQRHRCPEQLVCVLGNGVPSANSALSNSLPSIHTDLGLFQIDNGVACLESGN